MLTEAAAFYDLCISQQYELFFVFSNRHDEGDLEGDRVGVGQAVQVTQGGGSGLAAQQLLSSLRKVKENELKYNFI